MYCVNCGHEIKDKQNFCSECGLSLHRNTDKGNNKKAESDSFSFWVALACFISPIVGLVLFLCLRNTKPLTAKSAGIGALTMVVCSAVCVVLCCIIYPLIFSTIL